MTGALVVVDGPDYTGKTTVVQMLRDKLAADNIPFVACREPGGTPFSEGQRALLLDPKSSPSTQAEIFAFLAAKADLLDKVIYPALREDKLVLCDRYTRSLLAYQGGLRGHAYEDLIRLLAHGGILTLPHFEIILEARPEVRAQRRAARLSLDRMDQAGDASSDKLLQGYKDASRYLFATRSMIVDTSDKTSEETGERVAEEIMRYLKFHAITQPTIVPLTFEQWQERILERNDREADELASIMALDSEALEQIEPTPT